MSKRNQNHVVAATQTQDSQTTRVIWTDKMLENYVDICVSEIYAGNRPGTHFNKIGWKNVVNKFSEKIGKEFCYKQLKNKWDRKETGLGWDPVKKTIDATDEWWDKKLQEIPEAAKFQNAGLAHISKLDIMFRGITATSEGAWAPSFGLDFEDAVRFDQDNDVMLDVEEIDDSDDEPGDIHADLDTQMKESKRATPAIQDRKRKKGIQIFDQHFTRLCDVLEKRVTTSSSDKPGRSIDEVMAVVRELAEIENDYEFFRDASEVLLTKSHREMFIALKDPTFQIDFIKRMKNK
ncbi:hypothetical protein I3842_04G142000 [Carya illinoinensis]|uniref:Myb/SANT-like domain-containing protein n=1 Tax=Carya illinoinensis TaxID=32201 RepID=A0A922F8X6_CARIL|nr:hypothetical protein I3842_04G142000 [Carya illinoinensis]